MSADVSAILRDPRPPTVNQDSPGAGGRQGARRRQGSEVFAKPVSVRPRKSACPKARSPRLREGTASAAARIPVSVQCPAWPAAHRDATTIPHRRVIPSRTMCLNSPVTACG
jgi:hypothetical protein